MAEGLRASGVKVEELPDGLVVEGSGGGKVSGGATIASHLDHRIAMSFAVLGLAARKAVTIDDARPVATSFPAFVPLMVSLGAVAGRSEERRVGKECVSTCGSRWAPYH